MFDQDEQDFSQIIETGVELILSGKATLEQVLARYPDRADEIRPELEVAIWLASRSQEVAPRPGFVSASRRRVVDRIKQEAKSTGKKHAFLGIGWPKRLSFQWAAIALVLLVIFAGTGGTVTFAQSSIPGDDLYAVKRASESVAYTVTLSDTRRVALSARFAERRLDEASQLMQKGEYQTALQSLDEYKQELERTTALIQIVSVSDAPQAAAMAEDLQAQLSTQAVVIQDMQDGAPADVVSNIDQAQDAVQENMLLVEDLLDGVNDLSTATPTVTITVTPSQTIAPQASDTPAPPTVTVTPLPSDPMTDDYPDFTDTLTETADLESNTDTNSSSQSTPVPTKKPEKTARPTNVNRDRVPGLTDNPSNDPKPTKEDPPGKNK